MVLLIFHYPYNRVEDMAKQPDFRNEHGRWDEDAELAYMIGASLVNAAYEVGIDPVLVGPLAGAFKRQLSAHVEAALQQPVGPDGLPS